jgi:CDP-diglyceride synthetase
LWRVFDLLPARIERLRSTDRRVTIMAVMVCVILCWELAEFTSDRFLGTHIQRGPLDTWSDVALGLAGALVAMGLATVIAPSEAQSR